MRRKSFTLIELVIVVAIIAILAGAMVPIIRSSRTEAREAKALAELDSIKAAAMMFHADTGVWPPASTDGEGLMSDTTTATPDWEGPYLDTWGDDPWDNAYEIYDAGTAPAAIVVRARSGGPSATVTTDDIITIITPSRF